MALKKDEQAYPGWVLDLKLEPPSLQNNTADVDRLVEALKSRLGTQSIRMALGLAGKLPGILRDSAYQVRVVLFKDQDAWFVTGVRALDANTPMAGLAVDLGTSRVVLRLLDLVSGEPLAETALDNPQIAVGPDVLARVHHAESADGLAYLNRLIIDGLNGAVTGLCQTCGIKPENVFLAAVAGNTAMTHLFMGLPCRYLIREPYIPAMNRPGTHRAVDLGLALNPGARVLVFPNVGSYFGGDLIAGILASRMHTREETTILVDVGTNAEVVLGNRYWLMACAGAAGPALEGGVTRMGMMAGPGVIDRMELSPETGEIKWHTIGDQAPKGICGSGVIDLAARLFQAGMLDIRGRLNKEICQDRLIEIDGLKALVLVPAHQSVTGEDLFITQADLDSLIRSKAAMYTILETIFTSVGIEPGELAAFYIAGTFGCFIDPRSAIDIGMLPDLPLETYQPLGNTSLGGASHVLCHRDAMDEIDEIRQRITYLELNVNQEFMNRFSAAKFLPHTDAARFPSVQRFA